MNNKIKKWAKWIMIGIGSFFTIIIILAIIFNQLSFRLLFGLGYLDIYQGNNERGNKIMKYAISNIKDDDGQIYHSLSVQNTKNGNYDLAITALNKAYSLNPEEVSAYYGWVLLYYYHDYERSLTMLNKYDSYTPNFQDAPMGEDIHYLKGLAQMQLEKYQSAIIEFDKYINHLDTTHGEAYVDVYTFVQKGRCLTKLGQFDNAINSYKRAIKNYENCTEAYYYMGLTHLEMNNNDSACVNFNTALRMIKEGYKSSDTYIEYFHEIYLQQIESSINEICLK